MARVLMFGALVELAGWRERTVEAATLAALKANLTRENEVLGERLNGPGVIAVVNKEMARGDVLLMADDEVGFVPPVSGG